MGNMNYVNTKASKLYARVQGGKVIEYPVTTELIQKRGHTVAQYYEVFEKSVDLGNLAGMIIDTVMTIEGHIVEITHTTREKTLEEMVFFFRKSFENGSWTAFKYTDIPFEEIKAFQRKLGEQLTSNLNDVAKERYDSLDALLSRYSNSSNLVWKKEAAFMQAALDGLWTNLLKYFQELASEQRPLPISLEDITYLVKAPSWSDMV